METTVPKSCRVAFQPAGKRVDVAAGATVTEAARAAGIPLSADCGGAGVCGQCRVVIQSGEVSPPTEGEATMARRHAFAENERLACRVRVLGDAVVRVPDGSLFTDQRLQLHGAAAPFAVDPLIAVREGEPPAGCAYLREGEVVGHGAAGQAPLGFAVDLGSTKIAGYLVDLFTGEELAAAGVMNPQIAYGEDVISRLTHAMKEPGAASELARVLREALDLMAGHLAEKAGVVRERIAEVCVVGNTALIHLFLALPVAPIALAPFTPASDGRFDVKARELGLRVAPEAYVHIPPWIGGFVGADHIAMILGADIHQRPGITVGIDIGTNTKLVLARAADHTFYSASCASGPAFEGAQIRDGMRAAPGAIETVKLTPEGPVLATIGDKPPVGLCGSGIIDAVAELWRTRAIDAFGRFRPDAPRVRKGEEGYEYLLAPGAETGSGRDVVLTQKDVSEIQLAKAAIHAGIQTLLETAGVDPAEVGEVVVAGAFGSYLNLESALAIGLFPPMTAARYRQVGNAAGDGAKEILVNGALRREADGLGRKVRHVELSRDPGFNRRLARATKFSDIETR